MNWLWNFLDRCLVRKLERIKNGRAARRLLTRRQALIWCAGAEAGIAHSLDVVERTSK